MSNLFLLKRKKFDSLQKLRNRIEEMPEDVKCPKCGACYKPEIMKENLYVCQECGHHLYLYALNRIKSLVDEGTFREKNINMKTKNPIDFPEYDKKIIMNTKKTGLSDSLVTGEGKIDGEKVMLAVLDGRFLMGSMGTVVGEKLTLAIEHATHKKLPLIIFSASGGARMQEGMFSLMQMAKTSAAVARFADAGGLYISYLTNPTTGGVSASFAGLGDITIAEPEALIGFAGPRVIEQTIGQKLPEGFQSAEFLEEHGFVDMVVHRKDMRNTLSLLLKMHRRELHYGK